MNKSNPDGLRQAMWWNSEIPHMHSIRKKGIKIALATLHPISLYVSVCMYVCVFAELIEQFPLERHRMIASTHAASPLPRRQENKY